MSALSISYAGLPQRRPWGHFAGLLGVALAVLLAFSAADWDLASLLDPQRRQEAGGRIGAWLVAIASPDLSSVFLAQAWDLTLQTLSAAIVGSLLAILIAWPLALGASRAVSVGERGGGWWRRLPLSSPAALLCSLCRLLQDILRAVPDFVWAIILVAMIGLGPLTGALALALNMAGILAKVYSELWDSVDENRYRQVRSLGASRLATFYYGIRPLASRNVLSFTLMRVECAIRNAAVIGAVGGGGLGSEIWYQIRFGAWDKVGTLILFTLLLTLTADLVSNFLRRQLRAEGASAVSCAGVGAARATPGAGKPPAWRAHALWRPWSASAVALLALCWALWFMAAGNRAGDNGAPRNHLAPAMELLSGQAWENLLFFERLLRPELDLPAIGLGDPDKVAARETSGKAVALFVDYGPLDFWRPAAWAAWHGELKKWFVWRAIESATIPLAIAVVGTLLGVGGAILLSYAHSTTFQRRSPVFTGESPASWQRGWRLSLLALARAVAVVARGVPEVMWAFLLIAFFGPGLVAGTLAIALHSFGVLARVYGESVDNLPWRRLELACGASRLASFAVIAVPLCWREWMTYAFFQFESNVRAAVVLGLIGVGGLGFHFGFQFEWFRFERAGTYLIVIILLTVLVDRVSRWLKISRVSGR